MFVYLRIDQMYTDCHSPYGYLVVYCVVINDIIMNAHKEFKPYFFKNEKDRNWLKEKKSLDVPTVNHIKAL